MHISTGKLLLHLASLDRTFFSGHFAICYLSMFVWVQFSVATGSLCDLGQLTRLLCALVSSFVKCKQRQYLPYAVVERIQ